MAVSPWATRAGAIVDRVEAGRGPEALRCVAADRHRRRSDRHVVEDRPTARRRAVCEHGPLVVPVQWQRLPIRCRPAQPADGGEP